MHSINIFLEGGEPTFGVAVMSENSLWNPFLMSHEHTLLEDIEDNRLICPKKWSLLLQSQGRHGNHSEC